MPRMPRIETDKSLIEGELTERIIAAFFSTYNELGFGFLESVYENALAMALADAGLAIEKQVAIPVRFRQQVVGEFKADIVVDGRVIIEIKAAQSLVAAHEAQLINYLKATGIRVGLLLNFGSKPGFRRRIFASSDPNLSELSA
jgi:GxxExxY protein